MKLDFGSEKICICIWDEAEQLGKFQVFGQDFTAEDLTSITEFKSRTPINMKGV